MGSTTFPRAATVLVITVGSFLPIARAQDRDGVVIMPLKSAVLGRAALSALDDLVVLAMSEQSALKVVTRTDIEAQLDREQMKDLLACDAVSCAAEIGGALGTRYLLTGSVQKLGGQVIIALSLIDTKLQETRRGKAIVDDREDLYIQAASSAVRDVLRLGLASSPPPARTTQEPVKAEVEQPGSSLIWLRCPLGQRWVRAKCTGTARETSWDDAAKACPAGFRLPTKTELALLLGGCEKAVADGSPGRCSPCKRNPMCTSMFGANTDHYSWSSSVEAGSSGRAWGVYLVNGGVDSRGKDALGSVRCVRAGERVAPLSGRDKRAGRGGEDVAADPSGPARSPVIPAAPNTHAP